MKKHYTSAMKKQQLNHNKRIIGGQSTLLVLQCEKYQYDY